MDDPSLLEGTDNSDGAAGVHFFPKEGVYALQNLITAPSRDGSWWPCQPGELLVVDDVCGREPIGGRKPAKWDLAEFYTQDFEAAKALSQVIKGKPKPRKGWWEWDGQAWTRPEDQAAALERWRAEPGGDSTRTTAGVSPGTVWPPMMGAK